MSQPSSGLPYGPGVPINPSMTTQADNIGSTAWGATESDVSLSRYINQSVGGRTGTVIRNGYTTGLNKDWWATPFSGQTVQFVRRSLAKDTGPVGRDNSRGILEAGVSQQFAIYPSLEDIYKSFASGR